MRDVNLGGTWTLAQGDGGPSLTAAVPGCVHLDLLAAGELPDLWWRDNEKRHHWVCEKDWIYERAFEAAPELLALPRVELVCEGLDTLATVLVNGKEAIVGDNMFRTWRAEVKGLLKPGENRIRVAFRSTLPLLAERSKQRPLPAWNCYHPSFNGKSHVRKMACSYGWDWGPMAPTAGIWRRIALEGRAARIADVRIRQYHKNGAVSLGLAAELAGAAARMRWQLWKEGLPVAEVDGAQAVLPVPDPALWWPNGMGAQPLYSLVCEAFAADGTLLDRQRRRIGLRTVSLVREHDEWGESFAWAVNGVRIFAKGANWVPADIFIPRLKRGDYERLLGAARDAHMNCIRCWGGGIYEEAAFYEVCDEMGLLVWQDFMFACSTYPAEDQAFLASVRAEAIDNVRRLRHHPSLFFWCGNNELEQGLVDWTRETEWTEKAMPAAPYRALFDVLLKEVVEAEDGERAYWPCSPHTPHGDRRNFNDPTCGDAHCWDVWFGGQPFEAQRTWLHRFMSEFGFQSFPEPRTCESFTDPEDRNLTSYIMDFHQRSGTGNKIIFSYLLDWFQVPKNYHETLWQTQLTQALCIQFAAEHARRMQPRMMGCVYWQLNDLWPAATWSSIDVYGRWKSLHYLAARFNAPVLVSGLEDAKAGTVAVHVSNQEPRPFRGTARWTITDCAGKLRGEGSAAVEVPVQAQVRAALVDCAALRTGSAGDRDLLVWLEVVDAGGSLRSQNLALFARPKHLLLTPPAIEHRVRDGRITLQTDVPALWVRLELPGTEVRFSDNWFHLRPGQPATVAVVGGGLDDARIGELLRCTSVVDTWR